METQERYLDRKHQELALLNSCLCHPIALSRPASFAEAIEQKFRIAAALKAEHALQDWASTETGWAHRARPHAGPFDFDYDYQRADLDVRGPSVYPPNSVGAQETIYTSSGMAAMSALLLSCMRLMPGADIIALPHSYSETLELIETHLGKLRLIRLNCLTDVLPPNRRRILLLDSCTSADAFAATLDWVKPDVDLVVFDTTCFCSSSGQIHRVVSWARTWDLPLVLIRSHTKLDSLGVEYGRLGSCVFVPVDKLSAAVSKVSATKVVNEMRNAVRLFGGAALPAHFPPYAAGKAYRVLTRRRVAAMLHNGRRMAHYFASALADIPAELNFAHGVYVTLAPSRTLDDRQTRQIAQALCSDMQKAGLPLYHAGSFGFDFGTAEWFYDSTLKRCLVRIAASDLPTLLWDQVTRAVAQWWRELEARKSRSLARRCR